MNVLPTTFAEQPDLRQWEQRWRSHWSGSLTPVQQQQLQQLYGAVINGNRHLNLTRITAPEEFWEKHLWDGLAGVMDLINHQIPLPASPCTVIDIGTGAGFPGLPLAIALPHWQFHLLEATQKKVAFGQTTVVQLGLTNVQWHGDRVETFAHQLAYREQYAIATIRAVGAPSVCAEYTLPLLKYNGLAILYRGHWQDEDTPALEQSVTQLGGTIEAITKRVGPLSQSVRHYIYLRKVTPTPEGFPRAVGKPPRQPL